MCKTHVGLFPKNIIMRVKLLLLFLSLLVGTNGYILGVNNKTYYVSSSIGNDSNNGLSEKSPFRSISSIKHKKNVVVKLKSGDVFFETISGFENTSIEIYGGSDNAVICGFKILKNKTAWIKTDTLGLWRLDLSKLSDFCGFLSRNNNIGMIYDYDNDKVYGHNVPMKWDLKKHGDFFVSQYYKKDSATKHPIKNIIFKFEGNPVNCGTLMFSTPETGISNMNNCKISYVSVVGFSCHGICSCNNTTISKCTLDLIGGAIQYDLPYWIRYGNGIEFWNACKNNTVTNCLISRVYDSGCTIQANCSMKANPQNIHFINNKFYHCRQAFEHFLNATNDYKPEYVNCSFSNNVAYLMGENEFSSGEKRDADILSYEKTPLGIEISNNTFWGAPYYCGYNFSSNIHDNVVYIYKGQYLNHYHGIKDYKTIYADSFKDIKNYASRTGDNSKIFIVNQDDNQYSKVEKQIRKHIDWKKIDLHLERILK